MYKFKILLEQASDTLIDKLANLIFSKYHKRFINSIFDTVNSSFKKIVSYLREKHDKTGKTHHYNVQKSFDYAEMLKEKLENKFGSVICFNEKYRHNYSFFMDEGKFIPYLRLNIIESVIKLGFGEDPLVGDIIIRPVIEHDEVEECIKYKNIEFEGEIYDNFPMETSILYLKVRPFIVSDKKIIVIEEIQSTLIGTLLEDTDVEYLTAKEWDEIYYFQQLIKKYLKDIINLLKNNCDALYLVRRGIPKNQRFLYEDYEQYRCGSPFKNKEFIILISSFITKDFLEYYRLNFNYEYLYCLKKIENIEHYDFNVYSLVNSYVSLRLNNLTKHDVEYWDGSSNDSDLKILFTNLCSEKFNEIIDDKFKGKIKKVELNSIEYFLVTKGHLFETDNQVIITSYIEFKSDCTIEFDTNIEKHEVFTKKSSELLSKKLHHKLINLTMSELENKNILGLKPHIEIKLNRSKYSDEIKKDIVGRNKIRYSLNSKIQFLISFYFDEVLRKAGIKVQLD